MREVAKPVHGTGEGRPALTKKDVHLETDNTISYNISICKEPSWIVLAYQTSVRGVACARELNGGSGGRGDSPPKHR